MKSPKRPRDPAQLAKLIVDIAMDEVEEGKPAEITDSQRAAAESGKRGGLARKESTPLDRRVEIAKKAAIRPWETKSPVQALKERT